MVDLRNRRFGMLVAVRPTKKRSAGKSVMWDCRCDCNKRRIHEFSAASLLHGGVDSCGCKNRDEGIRRRVRELREEGLTFREIGAVLGFSRQRAHAICHLPTTKVTGTRAILGEGFYEEVEGQR